MNRGGTRPGAGKPKTLKTIVKKSYILEPKHADKIKAWAKELGVSESEALRKMVEKAAKKPG